jgi:hypothetical protein
MDADGQQGGEVHGDIIAQAAEAAADETVEAIDVASKLNQDPAVGRALEDAALKADKTTSRVSWLRSFIDRFVHPSPA